MKLSKGSVSKGWLDLGGRWLWSVVVVVVVVDWDLWAVELCGIVDFLGLWDWL
jgi:hypothetical protein